MNSQPSEWKKIIAAEGFAQISTTGKKVKTKDCAPIGKYPVVDQGQEMIGGYVDDSEKLISLNEPLIVFGDHTRAVKWVDFSFVPGADGTKILQAEPYLLPRFAYQQLRSLEIPNKGYSRHFKFLKELEFSVPPLAEQKVIADKLDSLLAQVENTKARLERIPQILKRFRQSVLAAAVSGRLTEMPPASATERVTLGQIAVDIRYGTSKKCSESAGSTPVLRIPNIGDGYINQNNLKFADFDEKERAKLALEQGDLLLIRSNGSLDLVGKTALAQDKDIGLLFAGYLIRVRLDNQIADPAYVSLCLRSPETRAIIEEKAKSTSGVNNINSKELASLELSLPSTEIQQEIVRRVDQLFAHADRIEQQVNNALARVNNLTQSILAKAFRGELTEQWRRNNPELISGENSAEALLERIKAERAAAKPAKKSRKKVSS